jgi:hypothetical protein
MANEIVGVTELRARLIAVAATPPTMLKMLGAATIYEAKALAPRKTSNLSRTIDVTSLTAVSVTITAKAAYAAYVELGTPAHDIKPNAKLALSFASNWQVTQRFGAQKGSIFRLTGSIRAGALKKFGNAAFTVVKLVHHPGTKPQPYLKPGAEKAIETVGLGNIVVAAWDSAL